MAGAAYTRPVQDEAGQNPSTDGGGAHDVPSLTEEPLAIDSFWKEECFLQGHSIYRALHTLIYNSHISTSK